MRGPVKPTLSCLTAIHRHRAVAVPYDNLDVQLRVKVGQGPAAIYDKVVGRRRGGWCCELNGMLQQALVAIGFDVQRVAGGVHRHERGDAAVGNHLCCWCGSIASTSPTSGWATEGTEKRLIDSVDESEATLAGEFGIAGVSLAPAWPAIVARHEVVCGA